MLNSLTLLYVGGLQIQAYGTRRAPGTMHLPACADSACAHGLGAAVCGSNRRDDKVQAGRDDWDENSRDA